MPEPPAAASANPGDPAGEPFWRRWRSRVDPSLTAVASMAAPRWVEAQMVRDRAECYAAAVGARNAAGVIAGLFAALPPDDAERAVRALLGGLSAPTPALLTAVRRFGLDLPRALDLPAVGVDGVMTRLRLWYDAEGRDPALVALWFGEFHAAQAALILFGEDVDPRRVAWMVGMVRLAERWES